MLGVQKQLHQVEAWKMAELRRTLEELEASQAELIGALNDDDALHGLFLGNLASRLRSLSEKAARISDERELQSHKLIRQAGRVKIVGRLARAIDLQDARAEAQRELLETIEHFLARSRARLP